MKKTIVIFLFSIIPAFSLFGQSPNDTNYIKLTYGGPRSDRTIPDVVFSYKQAGSKLYDFGLFFKLRKRDFVAIKKAIQTSKEITQIDSTKNGYYKFIVVFDSEILLFKAINSEMVNSVFNKITTKISKSSLRKRVGEALATIYEAMLNVY